MTAHAMHSDRERSLQAGMNDHISKPIEPALLFTTLSRWISVSGKRFTGSLQTPAQPDYEVLKPLFRVLAHYLDLGDLEAVDAFQNLRHALLAKYVSINTQPLENAIREFDFEVSLERLA